MANIFQIQLQPPGMQTMREPFAFRIGNNMSVPASQTPMVPIYQYPTHVTLLQRTDWQDQESREAYMEACIEQDIAWQIRINRTKRSMTQRQLAKKLKTTQTSIARWEDPCYGRHSIPSLLKVAHAFGCALSVRLIPYSKLAVQASDTSDDAFFAPSYESEMKELNYGR
ncbi:hypothetical protein A1342_06705 [Methylomonas methanica]|uniref:HTH cro/C1-type domain-containing protein n=2 Tax=Methylomonas TaxID=416 RepID=A0A140E5G6_9GAMM|nr:helix-turn-helix domain-containing protein [Methylomonas methanica]AMK75640.1 hypothetical protein JT25_003915 [Methylomonas denitrificans]OAH96151.1 hypothetical protein A1342_06705 [Methylomonas methanica]